MEQNKIEFVLGCALSWTGGAMVAAIRDQDGFTIAGLAGALMLGITGATKGRIDRFIDLNFAGDSEVPSVEAREAQGMYQLRVLLLGLIPVAGYLILLNQL